MPQLLNGVKKKQNYGIFFCFIRENLLGCSKSSTFVPTIYIYINNTQKINN